MKEMVLESRALTSWALSAVLQSLSKLAQSKKKCPDTSSFSPPNMTSRCFKICTYWYEWISFWYFIHLASNSLASKFHHRVISPAIIFHPHQNIVIHSSKANSTNNPKCNLKCIFYNFDNQLNINQKSLKLVMKTSMWPYMQN